MKRIFGITLVVLLTALPVFAQSPFRRSIDAAAATAGRQAAA